MNVTLFGKSDFADVIKLRIWRWEDYPGYLVGPKCNYKCPYKSWAEGDWTKEEKAAK